MKNNIRSEQTQNRIMQAALRLFAEQGYNAAGVAEICLAAGVSKGAFYHHFPGKNALFVALLETWLEELDQRLEAIANEPAAFPDMLMQMADMIGEVFNTYHSQIPMLFEFWMQASRDEEVWKATMAPFQRYQVYFNRLFTKGIEEGHIDLDDPQAGAQALVSLAVGHLLQGMLVPQATDWGAATKQSINLLLNGMKRCV